MAPLTQGEIPQSAEPPASKGASEGILPPLCDRENPACARLIPAEEALSSGDPERAMKLLTALSPEQRSDVQAAWLVLFGRSRLETDTLAYGTGGEASEEALAHFRRALSLDVSSGVARLQIARALLSLGQGGDAIADLIPLAERYGGDAEVQAALGIAFLSTGRVARALEPLKKAVELDADEPERLIVLGTAHMLLGDLVQAERRLVGAVSLDGNSPRAHGDLGAVLLLQGRVVEGKAHLERAFGLSPGSATYAANLSYAELLAGRAKEARGWAARALDLDADLASAWLNLGLSQVELGQMAEARKSFEKARSLDPSDPRPENNLRDLDEIEAQSASQ